jgi:hypothetical protein
MKISEKQMKSLKKFNELFQGLHFSQVDIQTKTSQLVQQYVERFRDTRSGIGSPLTIAS